MPHAEERLLLSTHWRRIREILLLRLVRPRQFTFYLAVAYSLDHPQHSWPYFSQHVRPRRSLAYAVWPIALLTGTNVGVSAKHMGVAHESDLGMSP
jgi:hypothetical protein